MDTIIRPTTSQITDAIAAESEYEELLAEIVKAGMVLTPSAVARILTPTGALMQQQFPGATLATAFALVATVAVNHAADLLMQVQASHPVGDAQRDGRVRAFRTFFERMLTHAVQERALRAASQAKGLETLANINGKLG